MENDTLINFDFFHKVKIKAFDAIIFVIEYFLPSGLVSFYWINSIWAKWLITFTPSIIFFCLSLLKVGCRYWFITRKITQTFGKKILEFDGRGFYFLNLTEEIKKLKNNSGSDVLTKVNGSTYRSQYRIYYSAWKNKLFIRMSTISYGVESSTSDALFSYLKFSRKNPKDFQIYYSYSNEKKSSANQKSDQIHDLHNHIGYGRIMVKDLKIADFTYVSDFTDRFSFGSLTENKANEVKILEQENSNYA